MANTIPRTVEMAVDVFAIVAGGTVSLVSLPLPHGYQFKKIDIAQCEFKDRFLRPDGKLQQQYIFSQLDSPIPDSVECICLVKTDIVECPIEAFTVGEMMSQSSGSLGEVVNSYQTEQYKTIRNIFTKLRIYKAGNIDVSSIVFRFTGQYAINKKQFHSELAIADSQTVYQNHYSVTENDIQHLVSVLSSVSQAEELLDHVIDKFEIGCKAYEDAIALKELITVGETLLVGYNSSDDGGKKEKLAKRTASNIGNSGSEITTIYLAMKKFYKYRSDDTHEADNSQITEADRMELCEYMRRTLNIFLAQVNQELATNNRLDFNSVKKIIVPRIIQSAQTNEASNLFLP